MEVYRRPFCQRRIASLGKSQRRVHGRRPINLETGPSLQLAKTDGGASLARSGRRTATRAAEVRARYFSPVLQAGQSGPADAARLWLFPRGGPPECYSGSRCPDVLQITLARYKSSEPGLAVGHRGASPLLEQADKGPPNVGRHVRGLAADENYTLLLEQLPDLIAMGSNRVLYIGSRLARLAREGGEQPRDSGGLETPQLILIEKILQRIAAAKEQYGLAYRNASLLQGRALFEESAERRPCRGRP